MEASDAIDEQLALAGPDTRKIRTDDYLLLRYPDRLRSPTMGLVQAWTFARATSSASGSVTGPTLACRGLVGLLAP